MNSEPLSESSPSRRKGSLPRMSLSASMRPLAGAVTHDAGLGPARGDVDGAERVGELAARVAALVADQVDLEEAGPGVIPLGEGAHRDLAPQERARLGQAAALEAQPAAFAGEQAVERRRRGRCEQLALFGGEARSRRGARGPRWWAP